MSSPKLGAANEDHKRRPAALASLNGFIYTEQNWAGRRNKSKKKKEKPKGLQVYHETIYEREENENSGRERAILMGANPLN